ncbi:hypothetical protein [Amycolatopsis kentuckyensis]|uniref:hypothetical protein n=1 Tax=Amycolatopsis kentuckyensis TaxID=218823 RepID=UPI001177543D|nr:hypothetical protein [Amycolatopsis kentuckyensis]
MREPAAGRRGQRVLDDARSRRRAAPDHHHDPPPLWAALLRRVAEAHGVHIRKIAADLGHSSVDVTEGYLAAADTLEGSAAPVLADPIAAGDELALIP